MTSLSIYSIDAGMPFARELAMGIVKLADSPERLARGLILLPSRRAARALQAAFLDGADGVPMLLPRMLPVGDFGNDDDGRLSPFLGDDAGSDLPPPISKIRRQICLAKLLRHFPLGGQYPTQPQAMRLADSLGQLLAATCCSFWPFFALHHRRSPFPTICSPFRTNHSFFRHLW